MFGASQDNEPSSGYNSSQWEDKEIQEAQEKLGHVGSFWDYLVKHMSELDSVNYVNHHMGEHTESYTSKERGLCWIIIALNCRDDGEQEDLRKTFMQFFSDQYILKLYNENESFFWCNKKELLTACDVLQNKDINMDSEMLQKWIEWRRNKKKRVIMYSEDS